MTSTISLYYNMLYTHHTGRQLDPFPYPKWEQWFLLFLPHVKCKAYPDINCPSSWQQCFILFLQYVGCNFLLTFIVRVVDGFSSEENQPIYILMYNY